MSQNFVQGHALIIGVGADLPSTITDAEGLAAILKDPERCAYPSQQVHLLTGAQAGRAAILARLDALAKTVPADATLVFFFSGHGYQVKTTTGIVHFLMPFGYDAADLAATAISEQEFTDRIAAIPAAKKLILLDCCHAGGFEARKTPGTEFVKAPLPPAAVERLGQGKGVVFIASSRADEYSYAGKPYSAFTLALLEALAGEGNARRDGYVRTSDLALHARQMVPGRTGNHQHPILYFKEADDFSVAYYAAGDDQPKGLPFRRETVAIEPEPGAWRPATTHIEVGSGAAAVGDGNIVLGERAVHVDGSVGGDINTGDTRRSDDSR